MKKLKGPIAAVMILGLSLGLPFLLFTTLPGRFTPPPPGSPGSELPPLPYEAAPEISASTPQAPGAAEESTHDAAPQAEQGDIAELIAAFNQRNPEKPDLPEWVYYNERSRAEFINMAFAVLNGQDPRNTFMRLVHHPDPAIRIEAVHALGEAENGMSAEGVYGVVDYLASQTGDELRALVRAATETIIQDTRDGAYSNAQMLLMYLGDYGKPAIEHLAWAARNHPEPYMRAFAMNCAIQLDRSGPSADQLLTRGLADPSGSVRLQALQAIIMRPLEAALGGNDWQPPWYLQLRPEDAVSGDTQEELPKHATNI